MNESRTSIGVLLKVGVAAFGVAALGVVLGFAGWYAVDSPTLAKFGLVLTVIGVCIGFVTIAVGQLSHGRRAVTGSVDAMKGLQRKLRKRD
jgi:hypothetical protein